MTAEVGSGKVAIFPTFRGFRRAVDSEVDSAGKSASGRFATGFKSAGTTAGKGFADGFKASTAGVTAAAVSKASADVARASREVSAARLRELDVAGRVRVAETQLTDARSRFAAGSTQVVRAEERLASQERALANIHSSVASASDRLTSANRALATASDSAAGAGSRLQGSFRNLPNILGTQGANSARRFSQGFLDVLGGAIGANIVTGIGFTIGRGINQGITAGLQAGFEGVQLASNLEQSLGAVDSVFKAHSETIQGFAQDAAHNVGLSQASYLTFATVVGAQLKNLHIPFEAVAGQTDDLITLGADLAAQFGGSTSDAVQALSSLLRGERDPIERYGVSIKQADINARLASEGLQGLTGDALRQAEIQATLAILWEQTADAQGTFFRESDTFAHKQQVLNAELEQAQTHLGQFLLPAFTKVAEYANSTLLPRLDGIIEAVGPRLEDAFEQAGPGAKKLLDKVSPLVEQFIIWGGEEGIPRVIDLIDQMADAAPGWAAAFDVLTNPDSDLNTWFEENIVHPQWIDDLNGENGLLVDFFNGAAEDAKKFFDGPGDLAPVGKEWAMGFGDGVTSSTSDVLASATGLGQGAVDAIEPYSLDSFGQGADFGQGFADGIKSKRKFAGIVAKGLGEEAIAQLQASLDSHSPSRKTRDEGQNAGDGFALGMLDTVSAVRAAGDSLAAAAVTGATLTAGTATVSSAAAAAGGPSTLVIVDADGQLIGRMRVVSTEVVRADWESKRTEVLAGGAV